MAGRGRGLAGIPQDVPAAGLAAAFERDLARLGDRCGAARALLTALAWGRGPGLPAGDIWVSVARALVPAEGRDPADLVTDEDARWLPGVAGAYLAKDSGPGRQDMYRLRHGALAAILRGEPPAAAGDAAEIWEQHRVDAERRVTEVLLAGVPHGPQGREWAAAHPYKRAYLAAHAAAAGTQTLLPLVRDLGFLACADPDVLSPLLTVMVGEWRDVARAYRRARPLLGGDPRANAAYLAEAVCALDGGGGGASQATGLRPRYRTRLAAVRRDDSLLALTGHVGVVAGATFGTVKGEWGGGRGDRVLLATAADDQTVRLWDPVTGAPIGEPLADHIGWIGGITFGTVQGEGKESGRLLLAAAGEDGLVRVWDPLTRTLVWELAGHTSFVFAVAAGNCPDGRLLLATASGRPDRTVRLWDPVTGTPADEPLTGHTGAVNGVAFGTAKGEGGGGRGEGRGGRRLLLASAGGESTVRVWDPLTGEAIGEPLTGHTGKVMCVDFGETSDGQLLLASCGADKTVRLWDPLAGTPVGEPLTGHTDDVNHLAFGAVEGCGGLVLASCSVDSTIRLWDPVAGVLLGELIGHVSQVGGVAFGVLPSGQPLLASCGVDGTTRLWDPTVYSEGGNPAHQAHLVDSVAFGTVKGDGEAGGGGLLLAFTSGEGYTVRVCDPLTGSPVGEPLAGHTAVVHSVAWGAVKGDSEGGPGRLLLASGSADKTVRVWDPLTGEPVGEPLTGIHGEVRSVALASSPGHRPLLAAGGDDGLVWVWDPLTGELVGEPLAGHDGWVDAVAFGTVAGESEGGRLLLVSAGGDGTVRVWDPLTGEPVGQPLAGHDGAVQAVAVTATPGGGLLLASGGDDQTVRVWDLLTGTPVGAPLAGHTGWVRSVTFAVAAGGRLLLASGGGDKTVRIWDPVTGASVTELRRRSTVRALAASGLTLAIGDDEGLSVIELDEPDR